MTTEMILLSIIIPTCNRLSALTLLLDSLKGQWESRTHLIQVIVSDDGVIDNSQILKERYPWVKYVAGPKRGAAANRNNGAKCAEGRIFLFLDDDCVADPDLIRSYIEAAYEFGEIAVFEGRISAIGKRKSLTEQCPINETGAFLWTCNLAIRREVFDLLRGFDERFRFGMEDVDFRDRLQANHVQVKFLFDAVVFHPWEARTGWRRLRHDMLSQLLYLHLHPSKARITKASYYIRASLRRIVFDGILSWDTYRFRGSFQLARQTFHDFRLAILTQFPGLQRWYVNLARPCCNGCETTLAILRQPHRGNE